MVSPPLNVRRLCEFKLQQVALRSCGIAAQQFCSPGSGQRTVAQEGDQLTESRNCFVVLHTHTPSYTSKLQPPLLILSTASACASVVSVRESSVEEGQRNL